jgi:hypothetical protein
VGLLSDVCSDYLGSDADRTPRCNVIRCVQVVRVNFPFGAGNFVIFTPFLFGLMPRYIKSLINAEILNDEQIKALKMLTNLDEQN